MKRKLTPPSSFPLHRNYPCPIANLLEESAATEIKDLKSQWTTKPQEVAAATTVSGLFATKRMLVFRHLILISPSLLPYTSERIFVNACLCQENRSQNRLYLFIAPFSGHTH